jgi:DNA-binding IclR family transcriptional regulator
VTQLPINFDAPPRFNGADYDHSRDAVRLTHQILRVFNAMAGGQWRTLDEIAQMTGDPPASVSAQLRHLRKERFGAHTVEKRHRGNPGVGLYEYRLIVNARSRAGASSRNAGHVWPGR